MDLQTPGRAAALEHLHFPGESAAYRTARNALLEEEMALREQVERVAAQQDFKDGQEWDMPMLNVFRREGGGAVRHFWGSELLYVPPEPGQDYRHNDLIDPLWNLLDNVPEGRGDFQVKLDYQSA
jgi:predicted dithiol-disulfide oxidoreductase (DUF899 family)